MRTLWRAALAAAMVLLIFEGALRKWVAPEAQAGLYLAKDLLFALGYAAFVASRGLPIPRQSGAVLALSAAAALCGAIAIFNPALPTLVLGAIGWRSYFWYAPLMVVVPYMFASSEQMMTWLRRYGLLVVPVGLLGVLQFFSPVDSPINQIVGYEPGGGEPITFGDVERVRVSGTFSFISGYATYLVAMALLFIGLAAAKGWRIRHNLLLLAGLAISLVAMLATGSRGTIYTLAVAIPVYVLLGSARRDVSPTAALRATLATVVGLLAIWFVAPDPIEAFADRASRNEDIVGRILGPLEEPFRMLEHAGLWGYGIGATHQASSYLVNSRYPWWTDGLWAEAETTRVMLEIGPIGFVLIFAVRIVLVVGAVRASFSLASPAHRALARVIAVFLGAHLLGPVIFNVTGGVYFWFAAGLLFALLRLEQGQPHPYRGLGGKGGVALQSPW